MVWHQLIDAGIIEIWAMVGVAVTYLDYRPIPCNGGTKDCISLSMGCSTLGNH